MTSMMTEPRAINILIDARIEQLRGGRVRPTRVRLPAPATREIARTFVENGRPAGRR